MSTSGSDRVGVDGRELHLLLVADSLDVGGAERHVLNLATALLRRGHQVTIACSVEGGLAELATQERVPVRQLCDQLAKRRVSLQFAMNLRALAREGRFDLVHSHMYASAAAGALALVGSSVPLVITEHSEATWRGRRARLVGRWCYSRARRLIAVSDSIRSRLVLSDRVPATKIVVIPNALPSPGGSPTNDVLPATGRSPRALRVGVIARLQPEKGVEFFVRAAAAVARVEPVVEFIVVGDGILRESLAALARELGLADRISFAGFQADAQLFMQHLDILVVPSLSEGTPLVILDAMSAGVPVVATRVGGIPEQVRERREGLLVPARDWRALADAICALLRDPDGARRMGFNGRQRLLTSFGMTAMLGDTEAVYRSALSASHQLATHRESRPPTLQPDE